jgi:hypothetical protein
VMIVGSLSILLALFTPISIIFICFKGRGGRALSPDDGDFSKFAP